MPTPGEHKTVQARILAYAKAIGWTIVTREEAERRRGFDSEIPPDERAKGLVPLLRRPAPFGVVAHFMDCATMRFSLRLSGAPVLA